MPLLKHTLSALCAAAILTSCSSDSADGSISTGQAISVASSESESPAGLSHFTPSDPVSFIRRSSNACPGTEGGAKWYAETGGVDAIRVTYGIRFNGEFDGQLHTLTLNPRHSRQYEMMCTGDGETLAWEPFVVETEVVWPSF